MLVSVALSQSDELLPVLSHWQGRCQAPWCTRKETEYRRDMQSSGTVWVSTLRRPGCAVRKCDLQRDSEVT